MCVYVYVSIYIYIYTYKYVYILYIYIFMSTGLKLMLVSSESNPKFTWTCQFLCFVFYPSKQVKKHGNVKQWCVMLTMASSDMIFMTIDWRTLQIPKYIGHHVPNVPTQTHTHTAKKTLIWMIFPLESPSIIIFQPHHQRVSNHIMLEELFVIYIYIHIMYT